MENLYPTRDFTCTSVFGEQASVAEACGSRKQYQKEFQGLRRSTEERQDIGGSISGMVFTLGVSLELRAVEVDFAQVSGAVALGFVVEVH